MGTGLVYKFRELINKPSNLKKKKKILMFREEARERIKNKNFTILCPNCIGGMIYHDLGMKFLSPTINLFIYDHDFVKIALNPRYYLEQELRFHDSEFDYPVATLGGEIEIYFNHYATKEDAAKSWERRKKRINWDNIYVILYDRMYVTREMILSLKSAPCRRVIVLTEKYDNCDIDYVYHIERKQISKPNSQVFLDERESGLKTFEEEFDFVTWLNNEKLDKNK